MRWRLKNHTIPQNLAALKQVLLDNRQINQAADFFAPTPPQDLTLASLQINPQALKKAIARIKLAIKKQEKVLIFADYDADGICATAVLWKTLNHLGLAAAPFIPHRQKHGYGISVAALTEIFAQNKPDLIITVDNGIVAHDAIKKAIAEDVEVIITDHHQQEKQLPQATAVVQTTQLCGASVAWILAKYLDKDYASTLLDLVAVATVADQVPLLAANRSFVFYGLKSLQMSKNLGLLALAKVAGIQIKDIDTDAIAFGLAPRINAMGRLDHGLDALRLLCTAQANRAYDLASKLDRMNKQRQTMTTQALELVMKTGVNWEEQRLIIIDSAEFHEGVIGLIAGKLTERFNKPAIVMSNNGTVAKASARSVEGVNIVELVRLVREDLLDVGGHLMAAGFSLTSENITLVKNKLLALAQKHISQDLLIKNIDIECQLPLNLIQKAAVEVVNDFAPFGSANNLPIFLIKNLQVVDAFPMGKADQHLKLVLADLKTEQVPTLNCVAWNLGHLATEFKLHQSIDLVANLEINSWLGKTTLQLKLKDWQLASD